MKTCNSCRRTGGYPEVSWLPLLCPSCMSPLRPLRPPTKSTSIPGYELLDKVGSGGMGDVYLALNLELDRIEALKLLRVSGVELAEDAPGRPKAQENALERFRREAELAARAQHANLVPVYTMETMGDLLWYTMPYIAGPSLAQAIEWSARHSDRAQLWQRLLNPTEGPPSNPASSTNLEGLHSGQASMTRLLCQRFGDLLRGLHTLHSIGAVHRDIKPGNILIRPDGSLTLLDLGIAHISDEATLTRPGQIIGTPLYMSPEQVMSNTQDIDHRSDVYSMGATLYHSLLDRPPFEDQNLRRLYKQIAMAMPPSPRRLQSGFPGDLEAILSRAQSKDPEHRYASARSFAEDLDRFVHFQPVSAQPASILTRGRLFLRRNRSLVRAATLGVLTLMCLGAWAHWRSQRATATALDEAFGQAALGRTELQRAGREFLRCRNHLQGGREREGVVWEDRMLQALTSARAALEPLEEAVGSSVLLAELEVQESLWKSDLARTRGDTLVAESLFLQAEVRAVGHAALEEQCRRFGESARLLFVSPPLPELNAWLERIDPERGKTSSQALEPGRSLPLPDSGVWTLVVEESGLESLRVPVYIAPPQYPNQRIELPGSPRELARQYPEMVLVPGGYCRVGSEFDPQPGMQDGERVTYARPFLMMRHEVTNADYASFVASPRFNQLIQQATATHERYRLRLRNPPYPPDWSSEEPPQDRLNYPVGGISIIEAASYAAFRGMRLPTEVEWEKCARGPSGGWYPWDVAPRQEVWEGHVSIDSAVVSREYEIALASTREVMSPDRATLDCSPYGAFDMAANAPEWAQPVVLDNELRNRSFRRRTRSSRLSWASRGAWGATAYRSIQDIDGIVLEGGQESGDPLEVLLAPPEPSQESRHGATARGLGARTRLSQPERNTQAGAGIRLVVEFGTGAIER